MTLVDSGEIVGRDRNLHLYRRALYEARRNDLDLNASESALLALLRREQGIAQVEHFLLEHHQDLREFWDRDDSFLHEKTALLSAGLIFTWQDKLVIPEDVAPAIWQTLGLDMPAASVRRLLEHLTNMELAEALQNSGSRTSGNREARVERILLEKIQPRSILRGVALGTLKNICRSIGVPVTGNKDELVERIVSQFAEGRDQRIEEPPEPPVREPRRLSQGQFETLFSALLHQELSDILRRRPELRQTGTKEIRIRTLWEAHLSEVTLLSELMNRQLEDILHRLGLKLSGSKRTRIDRIVEHFAAVDDGQVVQGDVAVEGDKEDVPASAISDTVTQNQLLFRQKASNPQASLQPWLDLVLDANGLVRCYATEDANPTKQLKNKLSQAAAAQDGMLVLLLIDEAAFLKAREALEQRWMGNPEWPKSVACVALAYPLTEPSVETIVERTKSPLARALLKQVFPSAAILRAVGSEATTMRCTECEFELPQSARYCPGCGIALAGRA